MKKERINELLEKLKTESKKFLGSDFSADNLTDFEIIAISKSHRTKKEIERDIEDGLLFVLNNTEDLKLFLDDYFDYEDDEEEKEKLIIDLIEGSAIDYVGEKIVVDLN